jgi:carbon storage regulator
MLVLTRNIGEKIIINDHIILTVVAIKGGKVRIGIDAPDHVRVDREEVHKRRSEFADEPTIAVR